MRIRTQFIMTMLLFGIILIVIAASAIITSRQVGNASEQEKISSSIAQGASELSYLSNDYLMYRERQQLKRWQSSFASFSTQVAGLRAGKPDQQALVANIKANQQRLKEVFDSVSSAVGDSSQNRSTAPDLAFLQVSWSRMAVQSQGLVSDASRLSLLLHQQMDQLTRTRTRLMYVMVGLFGVFLLASYMLTYRRILKSIGTLWVGAAIIGSGNLDFTIEEEKNDEIGELSRAFNRMTANLKDVTASKSALEKEISERKKAEEDLREAHGRAVWLARFPEQNPNPIIQASAEGTVLYCNPASAKLRGWKCEVGQFLLNELLPILGRAMTEGREVQQDVQLDERFYVVWVAPFPEERYANIYGRDITERKRAEEALRRAHAELEQRVQERTAELNQAYESLQREMNERRQTEEHLRQSQKMEAIGNLAGGIAHDFNNMLAAILGFTEMVIDDVPDLPRVGRNLQNILKSAKRARELVKQILTFSRKTNYERAPLSVSPLIKETVQLLRASIPSSVEIRHSITTSADTILAAPVEVQQILMNLATNASLAMQDKGGTMEISLTDIDLTPDSPVFAPDVMPGEYLQLAVKDTGIGMGPEVMKRVFEPFFTTREVGKGTGMGLAVVYGIVKDLQGTVTVESEPEVGSTFRVFFPKVKAEVEKEILHTGQASGGGERVLFVDDEDLLVEWGQAVLEKLGYSVTALTDSTQALKAFSSEPSCFDLVITDQTMPGVTGVQLAKELLKIRGDIPIILYTGHSETVPPDIAEEAGIREYLMKPLVKQELAQAIRRVLDANLVTEKSA